MTRIFIILLGVLALGTVGGMAWMLAKPQPVDPRLAQLQAENRELKVEVARLRAEQEQEQEQERRMALEKSAASKPEVPAAVSSGSASPPVSADGISALLSNPEMSAAMKAVMEKMNVTQVDMSFGKLMTLLNLNDQEKAHFKKLLIDRENQKSETTRKMADRSLTPDQRRKLTQSMEDQRKAFDETFKKFLNDEGDYQTFKHWEDTRLERTQFERSGRALFDNSAEPLSEQQEQQLIDLIAQARKAPNAPKFPLVSRVDEATASARIEAYDQAMAEMHRNIQAQAQAAGILTTGQIQTLGGYFGQSRASMSRTMQTLPRPK